mmetsp:Transcript_50593/g.118660  ORF Transcript_50593/g.118660 Transcript_50593/m.118660 type:complete len:81 (-) Transcript_50593:507-749(-)
MERTGNMRIRIRQRDFVVSEADDIPVHDRETIVVKNVFKSEVLQRSDSARLKQLANDAIRAPHIAFNDGHAIALASQCDG